MKVKASIKKRSVDCKIVRRKGVLFVINKKNPRFKQRQGQVAGMQLVNQLVLVLKDKVL